MHHNLLHIVLGPIFISLLLTSSFAFCELNCTFQSTVNSPNNNLYSSSISPPEVGSCKGPLHRTISSRSVISKLNLGCPIHLIPYYKAGNLEIQCGECIPGTSGSGASLEINYIQCKANDYCSDDAFCKPLSQHPMYLKECPYELLSQQRSAMEGVASFCGTGLVCMEHVCKPCREGDIDYNTGVKCILGEWSYASWVDFTLEPSPLILFILSGVTLLYVIVNCSCRSINLASKVMDGYSKEKELKQIIVLTNEFIKTLHEAHKKEENKE